MIVKNIWRDIVRSSLFFLQIFAGLELYGKSKVDELNAFLDTAFFYEDQVLRLDITMNNSHAMHVAQDTQELSENLPGVVFINMAWIVWIRRNLALNPFI